MSQGVALALAAMVFGGISDFVYKQGARAGVPAHRFLMVQTWTFGPAVVLYGLTTRSLVFNAAALWGCLAGVFLFTGLYNLARSLPEGRVRVKAPILRLSLVVTRVLDVTAPGGWRHAGTAGVVLSVAFIGLTEALARDAAVVVVPIAQMGFAVTALLGVLIMKEPFGGRMAFGLVASAVAMLFLARG